MEKSSNNETVLRMLAWFFQRNGYLRRKDEKRYFKEGHKKYKKGYEVRLVANSKKELAEIRKLLKSAGFKPGRPFPKGKQYCQPLYGKESVKLFLEMINDYLPADTL